MRQGIVHQNGSTAQPATRRKYSPIAPNQLLPFNQYFLGKRHMVGCKRCCAFTKRAKQNPAKCATVCFAGGVFTVTQIRTLRHEGREMAQPGLFVNTPPPPPKAVLWRIVQWETTNTPPPSGCGTSPFLWHQNKPRVKQLPQNLILF